MLNAETIQRVNILGVHISAVDLDRTLETIQRWISRRESRYICVTPAHGIMDCRTDPDLRLIFNASGLTTPDGMSLVWLMKHVHRKSVGRVYGPDLMLAVCQRSLEHGWRHFLYGGSPQIPEQLSASLQARFPGIQICGTYSPPFRPLTAEEDRAIVDLIKAAQPDILWVGISTPKQERWMAEHIDKVNVPVLAGVGAAFDFLSGAKPQAPRWIQRSGLEWLFRLASEPRRLWRRYAKYPLFTALVIEQLLGLKEY